MNWVLLSAIPGNTLWVVVHMMVDISYSCYCRWPIHRPAPTFSEMDTVARQLYTGIKVIQLSSMRLIIILHLSS